MTAIELAARAKVRQLVVSHHEPAYSDAEIEEITRARSVTARTIIKNYPRVSPLQAFQST
jgi:ribonuclease BN (tRNA processing enzyme)